MKNAPQAYAFINVHPSQNPISGVPEHTYNVDFVCFSDEDQKYWKEKMQESFDAGKKEKQHPRDCILKFMMKNNWVPVSSTMFVNDKIFDEKPGK